jgi:hypothetical protein
MFVPARIFRQFSPVRSAVGVSIIIIPEVRP